MDTNFVQLGRFVGHTYVLVPLLSPFLSSASLLEGHTLGECWAEFCAKFPTIYAFDWLIWPPSQYINFRYRYVLVGTYGTVCIVQRADSSDMKWLVSHFTSLPLRKW